MYATGSAANPAALLAAFESFASTTAGWTVDHSAASAYNPGGTTPNDYWLAVHKGSCYLNYWYQDSNGGQPFFWLFMADSYNGSATPATQGSIQSSQPCYANNPGRGPYTAYHLFSQTAVSGRNYLHFVVEWETNVFSHLLGGLLDAQGGAAPALYTASTHWAAGSSQLSYPEYNNNVGPFYQNPSDAGTQVLMTVDGTKRFFSSLYGLGQRLITAMRVGGLQNRAVQRTPNQFNELTVLLPAHFAVERASQNIYSYIGEAPDVRVCNLQAVNPKDEVTLGSDTWKYFPTCAKTPPATWNQYGSTVYSSGYYGIAFKKSA